VTMFLLMIILPPLFLLGLFWRRLTFERKFHSIIPHDEPGPFQKLKPLRNDPTTALDRRGSRGVRKDFSLPGKGLSEVSFQS
jgi:hypothetical protein